MSYLSLLSLPKIRFAHPFSATDYHNYFKMLEGTIEITYISKGWLTYKYKDYEFTASEGDVVINTYSENLSIQSIGLHEHHTVSFRVNFDITDEPTPQSIPLSIHYHLPHKKRLTLIDEIIRNQTIYDDRKLFCTGLFLQLLHELGKEITIKSDNHGSYLYVKKAKNYIFEHIHESIKQTDIATHLGITPEYLCNIFKQCENTTIMSYINRTKLEAIVSIMKQERLPLYKAAELYGYSDPNYVSRLYKKMFHANITDVISKE